MRDVCIDLPAFTAPASTILPRPSISRSINAILFIGYLSCSQTNIMIFMLSPYPAGEPKSIASLCIAVRFKSRNYTNFTQVRKLSSLLSTSAYLRVITRSKAVNPTHIFFTRYPHPKSLPSGKGLTFALSGSISGVSHLRNVRNFM